VIRPFLSISKPAALAMSGLVILLVAARFHGYTEPLERDITTYAVIAQEMLDGRQLYTDLWDHKPPMVYLSFAAAYLLTPSPRAAVFLANVLASIAALLGVFAAGRGGTRGESAGLFSAVLWVAVSGDLWLEGNQPNTEIFLNPCLVWGFVIVLRAAESGFSRRGLVTAGLLFAGASLYKQTTVVVAGALAVSLVLAWWLNTTRFREHGAGEPDRRRWLQACALLAAPGVAAWLMTLSYFAARGGLDDLVSAVFVYNRSYAGDILTNLTDLWGLFGAIPGPATPMIGTLLLLTATGCAVDGIRHPSRWLVFGGYLVGTLVVIVIPGPLYPHYFLLLLPPLVVASGWTVAALRDVGGSWGPRSAVAVAVLALAVVLWHEIPNYRLSAEEWSRLKYGPLFVESERLGKTLDRILPEESTFYELGAESGLYFSSGRRPPSGVFYDYPLIRESPIRDELAQRVVDDLTRQPPALIVVRVGRPVHPLIQAWVSSSYVEDTMTELPPGFALLRPVQDP
jgi:4-amino-4-deoxy-L-arabinose transferase-like glycosyltransferase